MKPALLVIDVQKAFFGESEAAAQSLTEAIEYINATIELFRDRDLPVICVQHIEEHNGLVPGSDGFDLPDSLQILDTDPHFHKTYGNSFNKTGLTEKLQELGVDTVFITGFSAEFCVLSTYRGAQDLDLKPIIIRGALASAAPQTIPFVERINDVISYGALKQMLS